MHEVLLIAGYEIRRAFRPKDLIWTLVLSSLAAVVLTLFQQRDASGEGRTLAVLGPLPAATEPFTFEPAQSEEAARGRVDSKDIDGLLDRRDPDRPRLLVRKGRPLWKGDLDAALTGERTLERAQSAGLSEGDIAQLFAPVSTTLDRIVTREGRQVMAALLVVAGLVASILGGSAYLFTGITGEKRRRVTETLVAIVSPQTWMDGKILGLGLVSGQTLMHVALGFGSFQVVQSQMSDHAMLMPDLSPMDLVPFLALALPGFAFWFCLVAAFCATIHDPETSARGSILLLPAAALAFPLLLLKEPESTLLQVLSVLPPTAPSAMSMRWILEDVAAWEFALGLGLMLGSVWLLRLAAGRIFAMSMLLHGSEPGLGDMWRAARHGGRHESRSL